jgi:RNA polymerase sigma factor (sigma-70 family)
MTGGGIMAVFQAHYDELLRFVARRVSSRTQAADIVQDAYLRVAALPGNAEITNPRAYLFTTASRLVADHWRSAARGTEHADPSVLEALPDPRPAPEAQILSREELSVLQAAIDSLPPRSREVFCLHKFEALSYAEIAVRLGIAKNTVMVHMLRALAHCRRCLAEYHRGGQ